MRACVLVVCALIACRKNPTPAEQDAEMKKEFETRVGDPKYRGAGFTIAPAPVPAPATTPGPAFLRMGAGVLKIDVSGKASLIEAKVGSIKAMVATPAGDLYAIGGTVVWKLAADGTEFTTIDKETYNSKIVLGPDGAIWVLGAKSVRTWTGSTWKELPGNPTLDTQPVDSLVIDGAGRPYLSTKAVIMVFDSTGWKPVWDIRELHVDGMYPSPSSLPLLIGPAGTLIVGNGRGTLTFDGKDLKFALRPLSAPYLAGRFALHGTDLVAMSEQHIVRTPLAGGPDKVATPSAQSPFSYGGVMDTAGRVWMKHETGGFTVVDAAGASTFIPPGGLPDLDGEVYEIAVAGSGPTTLPKNAEVAKGSIKGVILRAGAPIAKAPVVVCRRLATEFAKGSSPCSSSSTSRGTTDATGAFQIDNLPLLDYGVGVEVEGQWYGIRGMACGEGLSPGATCDLGRLDIATATKD
jgi:hypothetical protein